MTAAQLLDDLLRREGGYTDHPADTGGPTKYGITLATLASWRGHPVTAADVRALSEIEARAIYTKLYLEPFDGIDDAIRPQVIDIAVNAGVFRAKALLALAQADTTHAPDVALVIQRLKHYARIVKGNPSQAAFILGWINRAVEFLPCVKH